MSRNEKAIHRNLVELQRAIANRDLLIAIENSGALHSVVTDLIYWGLFNDYIAHCLKVFDTHKDVASYWYIERTNQKPLGQIAKKFGVDIKQFVPLSVQLKHIRDKTHFHIDKQAVHNPRDVWTTGGISGKELAKAVDDCWTILTELSVSLGLPTIKKAEVPEQVVKDMARFLEQHP
jgi:hypothetical protein